MDMVTSGPSDTPPETEDVAARAALARVLASEEFVSSPRLADFLRFVVEATLAGRAEEIKGYTIAVEALGRPTSFDPQSDPIVRVEATRLRRALERYYSGAGPDETLEIVIPKGAYVPQFRPRGLPAEPEPAPAPVPEAVPAALPTPVPAAPPRRASLFKRAMVAGLLLVAGAGLGWTSLRYGVDSADGLGRALGLAHDGPRDLADRLGMPVLEVRPLETVGSRAPTTAETHAIEARLRDAFARFDFVDVMEPGHEAPVRECREPPPRSVFSLSGLAEGRDDGSFSLLVRLVDRCEGTIVWSHAFESLHRGADMPATEQRVVRDMAVAMMQSYGVLPTRARAQAQADATPSGFGCVAQVYALLRAVDQRPTAAAHECLVQTMKQHKGFVLSHAVRAQLLLDEMHRAPAAEHDLNRDGRMLREAELAADLLPTSAYAARILAKVDFARGEKDAALAAAERALALNPLDYDAAADVGSILIGLGRPEQGEALLNYARAHGALRTPLQEAYLAISAFLRADAHAAGSVVAPLQLHPTPQTRIALALALHALGRIDEERDVVQALARDLPGGAAGVRRVVQSMLPVSELAEPVLAELENAGLTPRSLSVIQPKG
ncbi:hypothetical protein ACLBXM_14765 [Xanthobacteraceae bacterium A53D]